MAGGIIAAAGIASGDPAAAAAGMALTGAPLAAMAFVRLQASRLLAAARRIISGEPVEGRLLAVRIEVAPGLVPVIARVRDSPPPGIEARGGEGTIAAPPGAAGFLDYEITARPGKRLFGPAVFTLRDPLGLYEMEVEAGLEEGSLAAAPQPSAPPRGLGRIAAREAPSPARLVRGPGTEFYAVREYMEGDDYRLIEWKATARLQRLMVKELRVEASSPMVIVLAPGPRGDEGDPGKTPFELLARSLAAAAVEAARLQTPVGYIAGVEGVEVEAPPRHGLAGAAAFLDAVAATPPQGPVPARLAAAIREYLQRHVRGPGLLVAAAGPGVEDEVWGHAVEAVEGTRLQPVLVRVEGSEVVAEWRGRG